MNREKEKNKTKWWRRKKDQENNRKTRTQYAYICSITSRHTQTLLHALYRALALFHSKHLNEIYRNKTITNTLSHRAQVCFLFSVVFGSTFDILNSMLRYTHSHAHTSIALNIERRFRLDRPLAKIRITHYARFWTTGNSIQWLQLIQSRFH